MRFSLATMSCAIALALLGGCSASQNAATMPSSGGGAPSIQGVAGHGKLTSVQVLQLQLAGKIPAPAPRRVIEQQLKFLQTHPQYHIKVDGKGNKIGMWATITNEDALLELNAAGTKTIAGIPVDENGGYDPITVKVDKYKNAWVANEYNEYFSGSNVQEYNDKGVFQDGYLWGPENENGGYCGSGSGTLSYCYGEGFDSAETTNSVFSPEAEFEYEYVETIGSKTIYTSDHGSGIYQFKLGDPSQTPTFTLVSDAASGLNCSGTGEFASCDEVYYMDTDTSGNIWFDFYGYNSTKFVDGGGLGEVDKYGNVSVILPAGTLEFPGGVTVAGAGNNQVMTVIDQETRTAYQYRLPLTASSTPFNTIGPTKQNLFGAGDPISGGFNINSTKLAIGDYSGWINICKVRTSKCSQVPGVNFSAGVEGAAYTPSNK